MKTNYLFGILVIGMGTLLVGCPTILSADESTSGTTATPVSDHNGGTTDKCPTELAGTTVTSADVEGGIAITFINRTGDVLELRDRVRSMAAVHNQGYPTGGRMGRALVANNGSSGEPASGREGGLGGRVMPVTASVEDIEGGARIDLLLKDPTEIVTFRKHIRTRIGQMTASVCSIRTEDY